MEFVQYVSFTLVAVLLVVSPGPNGLLISKTVTISGKTAAYANICGFLSAFYIHGFLSLLGISLLITSSPEAFFFVKTLGAAYLLYVGAKALLSSFKKEEQNKHSYVKKEKSLRSAYFEGLLTNGLNPKVSMFYLAAFPQFLPPLENSLYYGFLLISIHAVLNLLWFSSMVLLLNKAKTYSKNPFAQKIIKVFTGLVFIVFALKLLSMQNK